MADTYLLVIVAVLVIILTLLITKRFKKSQYTILLTGLSDAGKTAIFSRIVFNKPKKSVTSLKENEAEVADLNIKLIDLPGAERLRVRLWDQYRARARHIMYVVDSTQLESKFRDASDYLYQLLADEIVHKNKVLFTIVCHKQDLENALDKAQVQAIIEKELNAIKNTKKGQLGKTSEEEDNDYMLQRFDQKAISLDSLSINLIETSIHNLDQFIKAML